jgi:WD40 repeat protein
MGVADCRFGPSGHLLCSLNSRGHGSVALWVRQPDGTFSFYTKSRPLASSVTALDAGPARVAVGTADGEVLLLNAATLSIVFRDRKAHMVFSTSVAFASDGHAILSTSGDASARVTELPRGGAPIGYGLLLFVAFLFAMMVMALAQELGSDPLVWLQQLQLRLQGKVVNKLTSGVPLMA